MKKGLLILILPLMEQAEGSYLVEETGTPYRSRSEEETMGYRRVVWAILLVLLGAFGVQTRAFAGPGLHLQMERQIKQWPTEFDQVHIS